MTLKPLQIVVSEARKRVAYCDVDCQQDSIVKMCNSHGEQGWHLAAITKSKIKDHIKLVFQRIETSVNQNDSKCVNIG